MAGKLNKFLLGITVTPNILEPSNAQLNMREYVEGRNGLGVQP